MDSAKHIAQADMAAILAKTNNTNAGVRPYVAQEVMPGGSGQLAPAAFEGNGNVLGFDYAYGIRSAFLGSISNLQNFGQGFELAYGWGSTPSVYSGFDYSNNDQSPPADGNGFVTGTVCGTGVWECLDRNQGVANLVGFHNVTRGQAVGNWWSDGNNAIAFSRGRPGGLRSTTRTPRSAPAIRRGCRPGPTAIWCMGTSPTAPARGRRSSTSTW